MKNNLLILLFHIRCFLCRVELNNDFFYGFSREALFQKLSNGEGNQWQLPANVERLKILSNDAVVEELFESCSDSGFWSTNKNQDSSRTNGSFKDVTKEAGIHHVHRHKNAEKSDCAFDIVLNGPNNYTARMRGEGCLVEKITGGAAAGDYDNDGLIDIFFTVYYGPSVLYKNNGDGTFTDVSMATNIGPQGNASGAGWIDVDSDGDLDLYVTSLGDVRHYLYINHGGYFTEEAEQRGVSLQYPFFRKLAGMTPAFGDFDRDGYLDLMTSEWLLHSTSGTKVSASRLFRNLGKEKPGYYADVTNITGVNMDNAWNPLRNTHISGTHTFGGSFTDYDNDGWPELFVIGDFGQSKMFWNNRNGTFTECTMGCGIDGFDEAMGYTVGDLNHDGELDFFVTGVYYTNVTCNIFTCNFGPKGNSLYLNKGSRKFSSYTDKYGVRNTKWGWGAVFLDYNNDGNLDILATNGFELPSTTLDDNYYGGIDNLVLFENQGLNNSMKNIAKDTGLAFNGMGRGVLTFDYDNDGDQDVVVTANIGEPKIFENKGTKNKNWIRIAPKHICDNNQKMLCDSYGARVYVTIPNRFTQMSEVGSKSHFLGQSDLTQHFGVDNATNVDVVVFWPRFEKKVIISNVSTNQKLKVVLPEKEQSILNLTGTTLPKCQHRLNIKEITIQIDNLNDIPLDTQLNLYSRQIYPSTGKVQINEDRTTVRYDPGNWRLIDVGVQYFQYSVQHGNTTKLSNVTLDFRGKPKFFIPPCKNGTSVFKSTPTKTKDRLMNGKSNNMKHLNWGSAGEDLLRLSPHHYADNISEPASACTRDHILTSRCPFPNEFTGSGSIRPSARRISNLLMHQTNDVFSKRHLSDMTMHFGQFITHDTDHSSPIPRILLYQYSPNQVWLPIAIPKGDVHFDPYNTGREVMSFARSRFNGCSGTYNPGLHARQQFNEITAFIDGNMVYGVDAKRNDYLREHSGGRMRVGDNMLLPKNTDFLPNENPIHRPSEQLFIAGDIRANVQPGLLALHVLFVREHNRLADEYMLKHPQATDEESFQYARRIVIGELQAVTYNEYLPALLGGEKYIVKYSGYKDDINAGITNEFSTAAFRFGHSQVNKLLFRLQENGEPIKEGHALLRDVYFKPNRLEQEGGIDPILRGAIAFPSQEVDLLMVDEMRNNLFPQEFSSPGRNTGFDLAALNIQRGRDHGLADLNTVRRSLKLKAYTSFNEISSNLNTSQLLKELYKDINNIDLWVGGLAEDHVHDSELGETFHAIIVEQFTRTRDGDRFWYQQIMTNEEIKQIEETTLSVIIRRNSGFRTCPEHVFFAQKECIRVKDHQCIPKTKSNWKKEYEELQSKYNGRQDSVILLTTLASILGVLILLGGCICIAHITRMKRNYQISGTTSTEKIKDSAP